MSHILMGGFGVVGDDGWMDGMASHASGGMDGITIGGFSMGLRLWGDFGMGIVLFFLDLGMFGGG